MVILSNNAQGVVWMIAQLKMTIITNLLVQARVATITKNLQLFSFPFSIPHKLANEATFMNPLHHKSGL